MDAYATLEADLRALERKWEQITDVPKSPRSLMDVIEYSLGSQKKAEGYVNRLLAYFLDPEEPHGGRGVSQGSFRRATGECDFQEDIHDLLIEVPNEWFLMIELKFSAKDTQTKFYYREATHVGGRPKVDYGLGEYYLYIHQSNQL